MIELVQDYLKKSYKYPACFALATDFYINSLNFPINILGIEGKNKKQLQEAFLRCIHTNKYFKEFEDPQDGDLVLLFKHEQSERPEHIGIFIKNRVLHASDTMPIYEELHVLMGRFTNKKFMRLRDVY